LFILTQKECHQSPNQIQLSPPNISINTGFFRKN
jgi:hypothetical protein